ncbi:MAG: DUF1269 domain-containing protein [Gammaproteobacteria bacterium]
MRRRLYFLMPGVGTVRDVVNELLLARVEQRHIHVLARDDVPTGGLPQASMLQRSDLVHGVETGLIVGGATGAVSGVIATLTPAAGFLDSGGIVLICAVAGAIVGMWAAGMIATDVRNSRLRQFEAALDQGQVLLMIDVPKERVEAITELVRTHHEAHLEGSEPTIPAFP